MYYSNVIDMKKKIDYLTVHMNFARSTTSNLIETKLAAVPLTLDLG